MPENNFAFPKSFFKTSKRNSVVCIQAIKARVKSGRLPNFLFPFRDILSHYPELLPNSAKQYREEEKELIKKYGFTLKSYKRLINNTDSLSWVDAHRFADLVKAKVNVQIIVKWEPIEEHSKKDEIESKN